MRPIVFGLIALFVSYHLATAEADAHSRSGWIMSMGASSTAIQALGPINAYPDVVMLFGGGLEIEREMTNGLVCGASIEWGQAWFDFSSPIQTVPGGIYGTVRTDWWRTGVTAGEEFEIGPRDVVCLQLSGWYGEGGSSLKNRIAKTAGPRMYFIAAGAGLRFDHEIVGPIGGFVGVRSDVIRGRGTDKILQVEYRWSSTSLGASAGLSLRSNWRRRL